MGEFLGWYKWSGCRLLFHVQQKLRTLIAYAYQTKPSRAWRIVKAMIRKLVVAKRDFMGREDVLSEIRLAIQNLEVARYLLLWWQKYGKFAWVDNVRFALAHVERAFVAGCPRGVEGVIEEIKGGGRI
ncbi:MAG: hypothetical protein QXZ09_05700 [Candidatus Methanomethylicaceae archaeon]